MATPNGQSPADLNNTLISKGRQFAFFQAMRLLQHHPEGSVKIRPALSLGFPASDIAGIEPRAEGQGLVLTTTFMGLYGASSPLPSFYTEDLFRDETEATRDFVDMIHQRLYVLLFETWKKYRLFIQTSEARNRPSMDMLLGLCGLSQRAESESDPQTSFSWVRYAGLLGGRPRSAMGLETTLSDVLGGIPVEVIPFVARTVKIPPDQQLQLGESCTLLGEDSFVGEECVDRQGKFRVRMGPLRRPRFRSLLRGGEDHGRIARLIEHYVTDALDYDIELILSQSDVQPIVLGEPEGSQLGLDTALFSLEFTDDLKVIFPPERMERRHVA